MGISSSRVQGRVFGSTSQATEVHNHGNFVKHDVFLNHRGPDTKKTFVSQLEKELHRAGRDPFLDTKSLVKGQNAITSICEALAGALVHVAIFSPRYAESKYCLNELCAMLESKKPLIPVFYDIEPENLRWLNGGPFTKAFRKHVKKGRGGDVVKWKAALLQAANITGFRRCDYSSDTKLVEKVVAIVLAYLPTLPQVPPALYPVGLEESSTKVIHMLHEMQGDVRVVGICGMGGIGKTTLARHVYNQEQPSFQNCCFLKDVKEAKGDAVKNLQMQMLKDLAHNNAFDSACWYERIRNQKVLLVIDDISDEEPFEELVPDLRQLGAGSEVIITSRNGDVLNGIMRDLPHSKVYQVPELSYSDSLQLFIWYAFRTNNLDAVDASFYGFMVEIILACGGLPLALIVMGSYLGHKKTLPHDEKYWNEAISTLRKEKKIITKLRISYDRLDDHDCKRMVLDVACFMIGHPREVAIEVWKSNGYFTTPDSSLDQLIQRCLVKVDSSGLLSMHDLLRDMGRNIVMAEASYKLELLSHVWDPKIAAKLLQKESGFNEALIALSINGVNPDIACNAESYARLMELKYLALDGYTVEGDFSKWSRELTWLEWRYFPCAELPPSLKVLNLVVLNLANSSNLVHLWHGEFESKSFSPKLRILILSDCKKLKELPQNIGCLHNLTKADFSNCWSLQKLPESFSELSNLETLNLSRCMQFQQLPRSVRGLWKLRVLDMMGTSVAELPEDFGYLKSLREVAFADCESLERLPESFSELSNLETLNLSGCNRLQQLPSSVRGLRELKVLNMNYSSITTLPEDFGYLESLREVDLSHCGSLERLPESISELSNLETLNLTGCKKLQNLPDSVCGLKRLMCLYMAETTVVKLPENFGCLESLRTVSFADCGSLERFPESFSELSNLETLNLSLCKKLQNLPGSVCGIKRLMHLYMGGTRVVKLPEDFGRLQSLRAVFFTNCRSLERLPNSFSELSNLEALSLSGCEQLQQLPGSVRGLWKLRVLNMMDTSVAELPEDFGYLQRLRKVDFSNCGNLLKLPESFSELSNLETLNLSGRKYLQHLLDSICGLGQLRVLNMKYTSVAMLPEDFGCLKSLKEVDFSHCRILDRLPESFSKLSNLEILNLSGCKKLQNLPHSVCGLKRLLCLNMTETLVVKLPEDFGCLRSLRTVSFADCKSLERLPKSFSELSNLEILNLLCCTQLQQLPSSICSLRKLRVLDMSNTSVVQLPEDFGCLESLREVDFSDCGSFEKLPESFSELSNLETLDLSGCKELQQLPSSIYGLEKLWWLSMSETSLVQLPEDFGCLTSLRVVDFSSCGSLESLPESFSGLSNLETLHLSGCEQLQQLPGSVRGLWKLRVLNMMDTSVAELPEDFGYLQRLRKVDFSNCGNLLKLPESFSELSNLETLNLSGCKQLQRLPNSVRGLYKLRVLNMMDTSVAELPEDFGCLTSLRIVYFSDCCRLEKLPESFAE